MAPDSTGTAAQRLYGDELQPSANLGPRSAGLASRTLNPSSLSPSQPRETLVHFGSSYQRLAESYERQVRSAQSRGDQQEIDRIRGEYEAFLEGWRANEELMRTFPIDFELDRVRSFTAEDKDRIRTQLAAAEVLNSSFPEERLMRANALYLLGEPHKALKGYDRLLGLLFDQALLQRHRGLCFLQIGAWDLAQSAFERAIDLESSHPSGPRGKGVALLKQGHVEEALVYFGRSLELAPEEAETHFQIGEALGSLDRVQEACAAYKRALQNAPDEPRYIHRYARTLVCIGELDDAIDAFDKAFDQQAFNADDAIEHLKRITSSPTPVSSNPIGREVAAPQPAPSRAPAPRRSHYRRRRSRRPTPMLYLGGIVLAFFLSVVLNDFLRDLRFRQRMDSRAASPAHSTVGPPEAPPTPATHPVPQPSR